MRRNLKLITLTLVLVLTAGAASANELPARVNMGASSVDWQPLGQFASMSLTITGPGGFAYHQTFAQGESPLFNIFDKAGQALADGGYNWELRATPVLSPAQRQQMEATRGELGRKSAPGMTQSGFFRIAGGALVVPGAESIGGGDTDLQTRDQVILDDLIVDGSACIGMDCVNGESFGFDTLRLKENNLRIRAVDTSSTSSFPSRDWQITFNDSSNGGANKFSIDDIDGGRTPFTIEAGAPSHSLYVDDGGRLGFGTSTPVVELHVVDGDTPTLRLEQDGSSGFTPQTWDVAGNETNFFIRDATNGSTLPFRIEPSTPSNALYVDSTGNIGLGTTSPDSDLDIEGGTPGMRFTNTGTAGGGWRFQMNGTQGSLNWRDLSNDNDVVKMGQGANASLLRIGLDTGGGTAVDTVSIGSTGASGDAVLSVQGSIVVNTVTVHPDYVFEPDFALESIEDHAAFMWQEKHLPALPKAPEGLKGPVNLVSHQMGVLEELEKAHIYIEQLHETIQKLEARVGQLETE